MTNNWFIIYPHKDKTIIKAEFEKLKLKEFEVNIIIVNDNISKKEANEYVEFINKNLKYSGLINTSSDTKLIDTIENLGGVDNDVLYIFKDGKITSKNLTF